MPQADDVLQYPTSASFNRRVAIEQKSSTPDAFGQPTDEWTEVRRCWAGISPYIGVISGFSPKPAQEATVAPVTIRVRYYAGSDITSKMRVRELTTGEIFSILYVSDPDKSRKVIQFSCQVAI